MKHKITAIQRAILWSGPGNESWSWQ